MIGVFLTRQGRRRSRASLSLEIANPMTGMMIAIPNEQWILFRQLTPVQLAQLLQSPISSQVAKMRDGKSPGSET